MNPQGCYFIYLLVRLKVSDLITTKAFYYSV